MSNNRIFIYLYYFLQGKDKLYRIIKLGYKYMNSFLLYCNFILILLQLIVK